MIATSDSRSPPPISLARLCFKFLRFGCLAFGGPVAQIAMVREQLVDREAWIDSARFNRLLAVMQALPGPEAHELCVHMGIIARGRIGGLLAGLAFMLPGLCLMLACGWAYGWIVAEQPLMASALLGVQVTVLAVIVRSITRIGQHILHAPALVAYALIAMLATLAGVPFWLVLLAAGLAHGLEWGVPLQLAVVVAAVVAGWALLPPVTISVNAQGASPQEAASTWLLFVAGLKGGLLTFGGAYTAIPFVRADTVGRGWLDDGQFLDGVAFANLLPAPLVIFATFAGYAAGGLPGALAITAGMFLPAFAFSMIFFERLEALIEQPRLHRLLDGIAAAAIGIIGATILQLALATWTRIDATAGTSANPHSWLTVLALFSLAALAVWRIKGAWVVPAIIAVGAIAGTFMFG